MKEEINDEIVEGEEGEGKREEEKAEEEEEEEEKNIGTVKIRMVVRLERYGKI